jgi:MFS transporter, ACS family, hexuronate transporter
MGRIRNLRWWIAGLLACASALSYLDRQSFPVAVTEIQKQIAISNRQYSVLQMLFLLAYSAMYAGGGKVADWLGTRRGYLILIVWWSLATILNGLVSTVFGLGAARFLLGFGEGGGFPCSAKAVSEWFPPADRAFAFGIFNTGSSVGAVIAPPLIAFIILTLDWRWVFFITGTFGLVWALVWWLFYDLPRKQKLITAEELDHIDSRSGCGECFGVGPHFVAKPFRLSPGVGAGWGKIPDRCRVVFLHLLAAQISGGCAAPQHQADWLFCLDSLCGCGGGKLSWWLAE